LPEQHALKAFSGNRHRDARPTQKALKVLACFLLIGAITHQLEQLSMKVFSLSLLKRSGMAMFISATFWTGAAMAHGDVVPQSVDTKTLPQLGDKWRDANPYSTGPANKEALRIGTSAYNQNCARCHGLEAISGGMSPDLRKLDSECTGMADAAKKSACFKEMDDFFASTVRRGRARDGRVYMPPFEGTLTQEAIWSIRTYLETRREP
jgi:cytochrome c-550 PedF